VKFTGLRRNSVNFQGTVAPYSPKYGVECGIFRFTKIIFL